MSKKKKIILLVSMVLVLALAAYINIALLTGDKGSDDDIPTGNFFTEHRANRQETRSYEIEQLNDILATEGEEFAEARAAAMAQKLKLREITEMEMYLESMLKVHFADAVVTINAATDAINVIVDIDGEQLTREQNAVIFNVISGAMETTTDYIRIHSV
jgi:hypothetical protein